jgi:hypothetical protein
MRIIKTLAVLAATAAAVLAAPSLASAATTCKSQTVEGVHVELTVWGSTSCGLGLETARAIVRRGYAPTSLSVRSPVTGQRYRLRRDNVDNNFSDYYSAVYTGRGKGRSTINVQLQVRY